MKKIKTFMTLDELFRAAGTHQVTAQEILNERTHVYGNWQEIQIPHTLRGQVCQRLSEIFGGVKSTQERVYANLMKDNRQHWGLKRVFLEKYGNSSAHLSYCAGQDMLEEIKSIRNDLKHA
jgi:hypothetical protein